LYRSRLRFFAEKLLSKWEGPFIIEEVYRSSSIKIASLKDNTTQVVNGQRLKHYIYGDSYNEDVDVIQMVTWVCPSSTHGLVYWVWPIIEVD
jgi:hypothetical protein